MNAFFKIITYFIIYSFCGWCIESIYKTIYQKKIINSGFLYGPYCPIYGCGAIIMYIFLDDLKYNPFITFCFSVFILSAWEYLVGLFLEKVFHRKYWDYSDKKLNLQGRVCLTNSVFWGILGVLFIYIIHPLIINILSNFNNIFILYFDYVIGLIIIIDTIASIRNNLNIDVKIKRVEELNSIIKEKIEEIKLKGKNVEQSLQDTVEELKDKRAKIIRKLYKNIIRMKKAFPSLNSEEITSFLSDIQDFFKK